MNDFPSTKAEARRSRALWFTLCLTLAVTGWTALHTGASADDSGDSVVLAPVARSGRDHPSTLRATGAPWPAPARRPERRHWDDAASAAWLAWAPPAPPPAPPPPVTQAFVGPREPTVPQFPYTLIGRIDDGQPLALLSGPSHSLAVKATDVIDGQWRIDSIEADGIEMTWLPGAKKQALKFKKS